MPRFYHMGEGKEPFSFPYSSTEYTIFPPDQHWKQIDEEYSPGTLQNGKTLVLKKKKWVPDEEANKSRKRRPQNYIDLTDDQSLYLMSGKFNEAREYIKSAREVDKLLAAEEDETMKRHAEKMADLAKAQAHEEAEARAKLESLKASKK